MVIQHNLGASNASRMYNLTDSSLSTESEKLSSGFKINRSADDAAGLSISEKMRRQIRGLTQSSSNGGDGISLAQIADGALTEVHDMLQRANELAVQAANGTLSESDRKNVNAEIEKLKEEINSITSRTKFNEIQIFDKNGTTPKIRKINGSASQKSAVNTLAGKIAQEYYPNAIAQILDNIPSMGNKLRDLASVNKSAYNTELSIRYIDGPSNKLAYMQAAFTIPAQNFASGSLSMHVDEADFPSLDLTKSQVQTLESTIAHEVMHGVMDILYPERMYRRDGSDTDFPNWFVEGAAQLTGGGYTTGWNSTLTYLTKSLSSANDSSQDGEIAAYLQTDTVDNREYGHGYLAAAYTCYLAADGDDVSKENLLNGADKIFQAFLDDSDSSFDSIMNNVTGISVDTLKNDINSGNTTSSKGGKMSSVEFVRQLTYLSGDGAGSITSFSLNTGGSNILGTSAKKSDQPMEIVNVSDEYYQLRAAASTYININLHLGTDADMSNKEEITLYNMSCDALTISKTNVLTEDDATSAIDEFGTAILIVSGVRSYFGAIQNRIEHTIRNLDNVVENTTAAESRIRDTDMASEMVKLSKDKILAQAGETILAQANSSAEGVMTLLS
ncbi:flagellin [Pseudobutyrivibrio sp. UC1225]|uniref:flagellinolysin n=1 Tax=Pseudobutyrivibrio sp. UC1225 TaxID=1798185 RepID=UPI0008F32612|nr:flagellinolysin [Pseudobutyrivibrio sp. UC1225]SFN52660.1 flagellin [Pseudobutyrivibrio sp. UC1225]